MPKENRYHHPILIIVLLVFLPLEARTWGLSTELNAAWSSARLVFPALHNKEVKYCIRNKEPSRFNTKSISIQVEAGLRLWLDAVEKIGISAIKIRQVPCDREDYNLVIELGEEKKWKELGSYQLSQWEQDHYFSLVKFDSGFRAKGSDQDYFIKDFLDFSGELNFESALIQEISHKNPSTVPEFSTRANLDYQEVFYSTYPTLIHELGHSFGLCDTYEASLKDQCDPDFSSGSQPSSVMRDADYFYLTEDDITGIQQLFSRYR